ncbi:MAG: CRISPR-associated endonuclease Cas4/Cas1 [Lamprocystis purpurea]|jgi:CRISPR-associated protein Cas1|uniref:CRISPR-associated endonuclease Cas4/Cas1 n=1 Tax=Lamprocystis purpurea TaxID=61598 RepID=UPI00036478F7|nr:CRISPR-associated endonuclease Cas4/Cas1 [Lamprocystis purpurea]MBV5273383.1 CRISPR-associated endonuclease Cas4/Cas1 [Lamprocystis purpurea]
MAIAEHPEQLDLELPFPELIRDVPLLPARMLNEFCYCPRLAYLEWVQGEWEDSSDTVEGRHVHRRVDKPGGKLPAAADQAKIKAAEDEGAVMEKIHARSITLSSNRLGLIARLDLIEGEGLTVTPVDYKRGKRPHVPHGAYDPERVQLCVQGMILAEHGYQCDAGVLYFAGSRERVHVEFTEELRRLTRTTIDGLRFVAAGGRIPAPLEDSPKCPHCSLVGICLPDEISFFRGADIAPRPLAVGQESAMPVYVQAFHAKVAKAGECLEIFVDDVKTQTARLIDTSQLVLFGNVYVTSPALTELMARGIPVSWHSYGGWFSGHTVGTGHKNVELRRAQFRAADDPAFCLRLTKGLIEAKVRNCRTLMRRNWKVGDAAPADLLEAMSGDARRVLRVPDLETMLGAEGSAAARYFGNFGKLIKPSGPEDNFAFDFTTRNRRPPTDPVNAMLSFAYTLMVRIWLVTLSAVGFDPYLGFYHQPRYGRPALALDLMEPFRPLIADSSVLQAINNGEVRPTDFVSAAGSVNLTPDGRKRFIATFERRMSQEVTHPEFGYRLSYRRLFELQARLLARHLLGELDVYPNFTPR